MSAWPGQDGEVDDGEDGAVVRGCQGRVAPPVFRGSSGVSSDGPSARRVCYSRGHDRRRA